MFDFEDFDLREFIAKYWPAAILLVIVGVILYFVGGAGLSTVRYVFNDVFSIKETSPTVEYQNSEYKLTMQLPSEWERLTTEQIKPYGTYITGWYLGRSTNSGARESLMFGVVSADFTHLEYTVKRLMDVVELKKDLKLDNFAMGREDVITKKNFGDMIFLEIKTSKEIKGEDLYYTLYITEFEGHYFNFTYIRPASIKSNNQILKTVQEALSSIKMKETEERFN